MEKDRRGREGETERERPGALTGPMVESEREGGRERVCVCVMAARVLSSTKPETAESGSLLGSE